MGYDLDFKYIKGKDLLIADALGRSHTTNHTRQSEEEIETTGLVIQDQSVTSHLKEIAEETAKDNVLQLVIHHHISENWSITRRCLPMDVLPFWSSKDQLSLNDGIIYRGDRNVVPATLRKTLTEKLHQAHMGFSKV